MFIYTCIHAVNYKVWEEMWKTYFQNGSCGGHLGFSIGSFSYFVSTRGPNAHHQVSIQLDYRGDVQNMNSKHFSHINVYSPYKCMGNFPGSKSDLVVKRSNVNIGSSF